MTKANFPCNPLQIAFLGLFSLLCDVEQSSGQTAIEDAHDKTELSCPGIITQWGGDSLPLQNRGIRGAASCATSGCHGGPRAGVASNQAPRGSEYPLWLESDPHAQSWKTLSSDASVKILSQLGILLDGKIVNASGFQNCLACHNTDRNIPPEQLSPKISEGVGCESCHGPSEQWYDRHFQGITSITSAIQNHGLTDSKPLLQRAKICATCHVGGKDRDMNHDIIAAGHPALYFDMAVYHEAYPKHWRDQDQNQPNFRSQLWLAGKIASADAELELIESRACKSLPVSVWPELSNYQCNHCHASLDGRPTPADERDGETRIRGRATVRNWNLAGMDVLASTSELASSELKDSLASLRELLQTANPEAKLVAAKTRQLRLRLAETLVKDGKPTLPIWSRQSQAAFCNELLRDRKPSNSWEATAGAYTAIWAAHPVSSSEKLDAAMNRVRNALLFPKDLMTPKFPPQNHGVTSPALEDWNVSLNQAAASLNNADLQ